MEKLNKRTLELEDSSSTIGKKTDNNSNSKSKFRSRRRKGRKDRVNYQGKQSNDPSWHGRNSQITKDLCSIPFNTMVGFPPKSAGNYKYMLGALRSYFIDWFAGISDDFRSFLNTAATNLWEFIRSRNSGATNYQSGDIFVNVILACLDMFATTTYLESFFTHVSMYSVYNRLIPKTFFEMRRIDYEDFISNIANYRGKFNLLIAKLSAVVVPDQFPIYNWIMSLFTDVYKDRDSETGREQLLIPVKQAYHIFDATASPNGGMIHMIRDIELGGSSPHAFLFRPETPIFKFQILLDILEKQINAVITDEDCNIIFGDLIKAYGSEGKFYKFQPLSESESKVPVYSEEFLAQFHNCIMPIDPKPQSEEAADTIYGVSYTPYNYVSEIKQDEHGYLVTNFFYRISGNGEITYRDEYYNDDIDLILDTNSNNPTPDEVMTMTRWHNRYYINHEAGSQPPFKDFMKISTASAVLIFNGAIAFITSQGDLVYGTVDQVFESGSIPIQAALLSNFDWSPICYIKSSTGGFYPQNNQYIFGDVNNVQPVKRDTIARIHDVDFASLYDVPFSGKF